MFSKKLSLRTAIIVAFASCLLLLSPQGSQSAPVISYSALGSGCNQGFTNPFIEANRWMATTNLNIVAINFLIGNQSTGNFSTSRLYVMSDSATGNYPNTILATFTPDVISGTSTLTVGRFVGSAAISSGTKFWIAPSVPASVLPWCYWNGVTTANMTLNGIVPDTTTSLSNSSFRKVYSSASTPPISSTWTSTADTGQIWQLSIETDSLPFTASLAVAGNATTAIFRTNTTLTSNVSLESRVTFYANGKPIANCRRILSSSGTATCVWKPSVKGSSLLSATAVSVSDPNSQRNTNTVRVGVGKRTALR